MNDEPFDESPGIARMEAECRILEGLAAKYTHGSPEEAAIRHSAFALIFATIHHEQEFAAYRDRFHWPLTPEEEAKIRKILGPDAAEE